MDRLRIGFLTGSLGEENGWARLSYEMVRHLSRLGLDCRVAVDERANLSSLSGDFPPTFKVLPSWPQKGLGWPLDIVRRLSATSRSLEDCHLLHCIMEPYLSVATLVSLWSGRPLVATAVGTYSVQRLHPVLRWHPFAFWSGRAERVVCISRYTEKRFKETSPSAPTVVVNPGVDTKQFRPGRPTGPAASVAGRVILTIGAVKPRKGHDIVIDALSRLDPSLSDSAFYIVGSEETHRAFAVSLREKARRLGIADRVHFLGAIGEDELLGWYRRADAFILNASNRHGHFEGFGLVLLEANACGTPVIACYESGAEDIVLDGENGFLVPQQDPASTANALTTLLGDPSRARRMGERGVRRAEEMSWEKSVRRLATVYEDVLARRTEVGHVGESREGAS